jgi:hypothetical protein
MIQSDDLLREVADRYDRLEELGQLRSDVQDRWAELYAINLRTFKAFAKDVRAYRDRVREPVLVTA